MDTFSKPWTATRYINAELIRRNKKDLLTPAECDLVERWAVEGGLYDSYKATGLLGADWIDLGFRFLKMRADKASGEPTAAAPAVEKRKPRTRSISLTDMECDILTKAVGECLLSNRVHISHCRLLLQKLERSIPPK